MRYTTDFAVFEIDTLPGNPQVAITHSFFVKSPCRGSGKGKAAKLAQNDTIKSLGYDSAICTVRSDNEAQKAILKYAGWRFSHWFFDQKQLTMVELWTYTVPQD